MKKLDLNIEIDEDLLKEKKDKIEIVILWIGNMVARATNKPDVSGKATKMVSMDEQRKYDKIINCIEANKKGLVEMEDDDFNYMQRKFNQAEMPLSRDMTKLLVSISKRMDEAKNG